MLFSDVRRIFGPAMCSWVLVPRMTYVARLLLFCFLVAALCTHCQECDHHVVQQYGYCPPGFELGGYGEAPFPFGPMEARCESAHFAYCDSLPYSRTIFPNSLGHVSRAEVEASPEYVLLSVLSDLMHGDCTDRIRQLACAVLVPECDGGRDTAALESQPHYGFVVPQALRPCRVRCEDIRLDCEEDLRRIRMAWPLFLECDNHMADEEEKCSDPTGLSLEPWPVMDVDVPELSAPEWPGKLLFQHHHYAHLAWLLRRTAAACADVARIYTLGRSSQQRHLLAIEFSGNPGEHELMEPEVRLVANIHGNEVLGRELLVTLAQHLCAMHRRGDSRVSSLLERTRVHIVPSLNPDGYQFATESPEMERELFSGRMNMQNMDLNRNFPDLTNIVLRMKAPKRHWGPVPIPDEYWSDEVAPETRAVMRWSSSIPFVISANLHGGNLLIRYPYDLSLTGEEESSPSPDEEVFLHLASTYADAHKIIAKNGTESCPLGMSAAGGVGSGAQVYNLHGGMQDFSYLHHGCFEITVELGCKKFPNASELEQEWENNREALFSFLESVHQGIKGVVRNENGRGIRGIHIAVKGNPRDVVTTRSGEYWRLLQPGTYLVQASGPGYLPSLKRVYIPEGMRHAGQVNFKLQPDPRPRRITLQRWKQRRWMAKHASGRRHGGDRSVSWWLYFKHLNLDSPAATILPTSAEPELPRQFGRWQRRRHSRF